MADKRNLLMGAPKNWDAFLAAPIAAGAKYYQNTKNLLHGLKGMYDAATLPGDVLSGKVDPQSDEGFERTLGLAGMVSGGAFPTGGAKNVAGMGWKGGVHPLSIFENPQKKQAAKDVLHFMITENTASPKEAIEFAEMMDPAWGSPLHKNVAHELELHKEKFGFFDPQEALNTADTAHLPPIPTSEDHLAALEKELDDLVSGANKWEPEPEMTPPPPNKTVNLGAFADYLEGKPQLPSNKDLLANKPAVPPPPPIIKYNPDGSMTVGPAPGSPHYVEPYNPLAEAAKADTYKTSSGVTLPKSAAGKSWETAPDMPQPSYHELFSPVNWQEMVHPEGTMLPLKSIEHQKRAQELGFNPHFPLFKGMRGFEGEGFRPEAFHYKGYEPGNFFTNHPDIAAAYAGFDPATELDYWTGGVVPVLARPKNVLQVDHAELAKALALPRQDLMEYSGKVVDTAVKHAQEKGADMVVIKNMKDIAPRHLSGRPQDQYVVLDQSILRAPHAEFDPNELHSYDLLRSQGNPLFTGGISVRKGKKNANKR